jgi:hypothetical protein
VAVSAFAAGSASRPAHPYGRVSDQRVRRGSRRRPPLNPGSAPTPGEKDASPHRQRFAPTGPSGRFTSTFPPTVRSNDLPDLVARHGLKAGTPCAGRARPHFSPGVTPASPAGALLCLVRAWGRREGDFHAKTQRREEVVLRRRRLLPHPGYGKNCRQIERGLRPKRDIFASLRLCVSNPFF